MLLGAGAIALSLVGTLEAVVVVISLWKAKGSNFDTFRLEGVRLEDAGVEGVGVEDSRVQHPGCIGCKDM